MPTTNLLPSYTHDFLSCSPLSCALHGSKSNLGCILDPAVDAEISYSWDLHVTSSAHRIKLYSVNRSKPATAARLKQLQEHGQSFEPLTQPLEFGLEDMDEYMIQMNKLPREPIN